jgi:hypothetical protein
MKQWIEGWWYGVSMGAPAAAFVIPLRAITGGGTRLERIRLDVVSGCRTFWSVEARFLGFSDMRNQLRVR